MLDVTVLLVTADAKLSESVASALSSIRSLRIEQLADVDAALHYLERPDLGLLLLHLARGAELSGVLAIVKECRRAPTPISCLVILDEERPRESYELTRAGAVCVARPLDLRALAMQADLLTQGLRFTSSSSLTPAKSPPPPQQQRKVPAIESLGDGDAFLFHPHEMGKTMERVRIVAPQDVHILLSGETGTGKTRLARLIHELSNRVEEPFLVANCGTLSANLIESEMFGHVRGAFTGADRDHAGKFSESGRGTLLLDEVDALPLSSQVKLLRACEERLFEPVGSNKSQPVRARIIAASNKDLEAEANAGRFRKDLFYRLHVVSFHMPPLRERPNVIRPLAEKFLKEFAQRNGRNVTGISPEASEALEQFVWPGNIRQLRNVIEGAAAFCPGPMIRVDDLPDSLMLPAPSSTPEAPKPDGQATLAQTRGEAEVDRIRRALENNKGNRLRAAHELGISRVTLYNKLRKYGLL